MKRIHQILVLSVIATTSFATSNLEMAKECFNESKYDEAINYATLSLEEKPDSIDAYIVRAGAYEYLKQYKLMIKDLSAYIKRHKSDTDYFTLSQAYLSRGNRYTKTFNQLNKGLADLRKAYALDSTSWRNANGLGVCLYKMGRYKEADYYLYKKNVMQFRNGDGSYWAALNKYALGEYDTAIHLYTGCLLLNPDDDWQMATIIFRKNIKYAIECVYVALDYCETNYQRGIFHYLLGVSLYREKKYDDAIEECNKALVFFRDENSVVANVKYYKCYCYLGKYELKNALEIMTSSINSAESYGNSESWRYMVRAQIYLGLGMFNEALSDLNIAEGKAGDDLAEYTAYVGDVYYFMKDYDSAFEYYERSMMINEKRWLTYAGRAGVYFAIGDTVSAMKDMDMVCRNIRPICNSEYCVYANSAFYTGHKQKAEKAIKYVLNNIDEDNKAYDYIGIADYYAVTGDADNAFKYLKMAVESGYFMLTTKLCVPEWIVLMDKKPEIREYIDGILNK